VCGLLRGREPPYVTYLGVDAKGCEEAEPGYAPHVFEYIAAEVPQVCTDTGEHACWVKRLDAGIVVKDTPEDIAAWIITLLKNKKLYEQKTKL
jgi:glycosyltransferase involved in cell wall biosynthesis